MPRGKPTTMPAKMINDMPFPMPRSVICSPSHMMKAVPVVNVSIVISMKPMPGLMTNSLPLQCHRDTGGLNGAEHDREITRIGRDLSPAEFAFLGKLFQIWPHDRQQLQNDRCRDVRHDPQRENCQPAEISAGEQIQKSEDRTLILIKEVREAAASMPGVGICAPMRYTAKQREHEKNPLSQIRYVENVLYGFNHRFITSTVPPAFVIFSRALSVK